MKIYYDTNSFWNYFLNHCNENDELNRDLKEFSPLNEKYEKITAPWTLDEFCHNFPRKLEGKRILKEEIKKKTEILTKLPIFLSFFTQETMDTRKINNLFLQLYLLARELDIISLTNEEKKIHSKDLLHLAYALISESDILITTDSKFECLENYERIKEIIKSYKLRRIIIADSKFEKIKKNIYF